jgi:hypothetical protein
VRAGKLTDGKYERYLRSERDLEAEERRARAIGSLIEILARAAAEETFNPGTAGRTKWNAGCRKA